MPTSGLFIELNYADFEEMGGDCTNFVSQWFWQAVEEWIPSPIHGWYSLQPARPSSPHGVGWKHFTVFDNAA